MYQDALGHSSKAPRLTRSLRFVQNEGSRETATVPSAIGPPTGAHRLRGLHLQPASTRDAPRTRLVEAAPRSSDHGLIRDAVQHLVW